MWGFTYADGRFSTPAIAIGSGFVVGLAAGLVFLTTRRRPARLQGLRPTWRRRATRKRRQNR